jgi:phosphoribosylcarboxyaminoimidazole (NCAIR) mutase
MDGLGRAVGDGISGLVGGAIDGITAALSGMVDALSTALPAGAVPVIGVALLLLVVLAVIRR